MIVFGLRTKQLGTDSLQAVCKYCNHPEQVLAARQQYLHIYWIPFIPMSKQVSAVCAKCRKISQPNDFTEPLKAGAAVYRANLRTPLSMYAGAVIVFAVAVGALVHSRQEKKLNAVALRHPHTGDVLVLHDTHHRSDGLPYTYAKVLRVEDDKLEVQPARSRYTAARDISEHDVGDEATYQEGAIEVPRAALTPADVEKVYHEPSHRSAAPQKPAKAAAAAPDGEAI